MTNRLHLETHYGKFTQNHLKNELPVDWVLCDSDLVDVFLLDCFIFLTALVDLI